MNPIEVVERDRDLGDSERFTDHRLGGNLTWTPFSRRSHGREAAAE